jgi:hypothetical protein
MSNRIPAYVSVAALSAASAFLPTVSQAQAAMCAPRPAIVDTLKTRFSEQQNGVGVVNQETVFELFVSVEGSWTMLATNVAGISCIVGSGSGWQGILASDRNARAS